MKKIILILIMLMGVVVGCSPKIARVSDEFLRNMSPEEIAVLESIEKDIVTILDERTPVVEAIQSTEMRINIVNQQLDRLKLIGDIFKDKERLFTQLNEEFTLELIRQEVITNITRSELKNLELAVLKARLADDKALLAINRATLAVKVNERSLERAKIARLRQDELFRDNPERQGEKYNLSVFEKQLEDRKQTLETNEKERLLLESKLTEAKSRYALKKRNVSLLEESLVWVPFRDTRTLENATAQIIPAEIKKSQLELSIVNREIQLLQESDTILIDQLRLQKFLNDSMAQKEINRLIENNLSLLKKRKKVKNTIETRIQFERAVVAFKKAVAAAQVEKTETTTQQSAPVESQEPEGSIPEDTPKTKVSTAATDRQLSAGSLVEQERKTLDIALNALELKIAELEE